MMMWTCDGCSVSPAWLCVWWSLSVCVCFYIHFLGHVTFCIFIPTWCIITAVFRHCTCSIYVCACACTTQEVTYVLFKCASFVASPSRVFWFICWMSAIVWLCHVDRTFRADLCLTCHCIWPAADSQWPYSFTPHAGSSWFCTIQY